MNVVGKVSCATALAAYLRYNRKNGNGDNKGNALSGSLVYLFLMSIGRHVALCIKQNHDRHLDGITVQ